MRRSMSPSLIDADFEVPKHGIYREIPIRYAVGMQQYALRFRLLGVDDGAGQELWDRGVVRGEPGPDPDRRRGSDAERSRPLSHPLPRRAGDPVGRDAAPGAEKKGIAIMLFCAGTPREPSGACPFARSTVTVKLPRDLDDSRGVYDAWTGMFGAKDKNFTKRRVDAQTLLFETGALAAGEGITVEVDDARRRRLAARMVERSRRVAGRQFPVRDFSRDVGSLHRRLVSTAAATCRAAERSSSITSRQINSHRPRLAR